MESLIFRLKHGRKYSFKSISKQGFGKCSACGEKSEYTKTDVINAQLARTWGISEKEVSWFNYRESMSCSVCSSSLRARQLARCVVDVMECKGSLRDFVSTDNARTLEVAEINTAGSLHPILSELPRLKYSEYMSGDSETRSEDIQKLSYGTNQFDLVITSDTLEHIPELDKAVSEIHRVLKTGGYHIFTIPILLSRVTKKRAEKVDGKIKYISAPSYHGIDNNADYLVFNEFGRDILRYVDGFGFSTKLYYTHVLSNEPFFVLVSKKTDGSM